MRTTLVLAVGLVMTACTGPAPGDSEPVTSGTTAVSERAPTEVAALPDSAVRHVVIFKYRTGAEEAAIAQVTDAFRALQDRIPGILAFEHGVNIRPEGQDVDFTHAYMVTFEDGAARDAYRPHPEHQAFNDLVSELDVVEEVVVVAYVPSP